MIVSKLCITTCIQKWIFLNVTLWHIVVKFGDWPSRTCYYSGRVVWLRAKVNQLGPRARPDIVLKTIRAVCSSVWKQTAVLITLRWTTRGLVVQNSRVTDTCTCREMLIYSSLIKGALDKYNIYLFKSNSIEDFKLNQYQNFQLILPMRFHFMMYFVNSIIFRVSHIAVGCCIVYLLKSTFKNGRWK